MHGELTKKWEEGALKQNNLSKYYLRGALDKSLLKFQRFMIEHI